MEWVAKVGGELAGRKLPPLQAELSLRSQLSLRFRYPALGLVRSNF